MRSLLFAPYGYYRNLSQPAASFSYLLSRYLNFQHAETFQFACDGVMTTCANDQFTQTSRNQLCNNCGKEQRKLAEWAKLKTIFASEFIDDDFKLKLKNHNLTELNKLSKPALTVNYALDQAISLNKIDLLIVPFVDDQVTSYVLKNLITYSCHYLVFSELDNSLKLNSSFDPEPQIINCYLEDILDFRSDPVTWDDYYIQAVTKVINDIGIDVNQLKLPI